MWIKVKTEKPSAERIVLAYYKNQLGKDRRVRAFYAPRFTVESYSDSDAYDEYNEDQDAFYLIEGWYEAIDNWDDYSSVYINEGIVTHWQPLPEPPK